MVTLSYFYVYYSYEEWGRGYIGSRECKCLPEKDTKYFGSFSDKTFKPTQKIILQTFKTKEEAIDAEVILHSFYEVDKNPHFANKAKQTNKKFYFARSGKDNPMFGKPSPIRGKTLSKEIREKMSLAARDKNNGFYGRKHSEETKQKLSKKSKNRRVNEETRKKLSEKFKGRIFSEEIKQKISLSKLGKNVGKDNPFFGKTHSEETKKRLSNIRRGKNGPIYGRHWFSNSKEEVLTYECPPGFKPGRLNLKKLNDNRER